MIANIERKWAKKLQNAKLTFEQDREAIYNELNEERTMMEAKLSMLVYEILCIITPNIFFSKASKL